MPSKAQRERGWLLPTPLLPPETICVKMEVPNAPEYRQAVAGALLELTKWWNWEKSYQAGDTRATDTAKNFLQLYTDTFKFVECNPCETPFWYDSDTVDDTECCEEGDEDCEDSDQNQWLEQAADWIITAFIAFTFTPAAAIAYKTTIPRVRLFFRTGDLGAIGEIIIDGILYAAIDTFTGGASEVVSNIIDLEAFRQIHNLGPENIIQIRHGGAGAAAAAAAAAGLSFPANASPYKLEVVRGDIRAPRLCDAFETQPTFEQLNDAYFECYGQYLEAGEAMFDIRVNGCVLEKSTDGGQTWTPVQDLSACAPAPVDFEQVDCTLTANGAVIFDASCAESDVTPQPEPIENGVIPAKDNYCGGVKRLVGYVWDLATYMQNEWVQAAGDVEIFVTTITLGLSEITPIVSGVVDVAFWFVDNQVADIDLFLTNPNNREEFECFLYCLVKENNGFNETAWESWLAEFPAVSLRVLPTFTAQQVVGSIAKLFVGFTRATREFAIGTLVPDPTCEAACTECADQVWVRDLLAEGCNLSQYIDLIEGTILDEGGPNMTLEAAVIDPSLSRLQFIIDVSEFASALWRIQTFEFRTKGTQATGNRVARIEIFAFDLWVPITQGNWEDVVNVSNISNQPFGPFKVSGRIPFPYDTTRVRVTLEGWGTQGSVQARISGLQIDGRGFNPFEEECPI